MISGYCPACEQNVRLKRNELDICLLVILAIFTAGIGAIMYLIIYYSYEPRRCVKCSSPCFPIRSSENRSKIQSKYQIKGFNMQTCSKINYCPNCGSNIGKMNSKPLFCPYCGHLLYKSTKELALKQKCAVCHQKVLINDLIIECSFCESLFHSNCVSRWLSQHNACPLCQNKFLIPERE